MIGGVQKSFRTQKFSHYLIAAENPFKRVSLSKETPRKRPTNLSLFKSNPKEFLENLVIHPSMTKLDPERMVN